jgi:hypothetical protein
MTCARAGTRRNKAAILFIMAQVFELLFVYSSPSDIS